MLCKRQSHNPLPPAPRHSHHPLWCSYYIKIERAEEKARKKREREERNAAAAGGSATSGAAAAGAGAGAGKERKHAAGAKLGAGADPVADLLKSLQVARS